MGLCIANKIYQYAPKKEPNEDSLSVEYQKLQTGMQVYIRNAGLLPQKMLI
jgi:hypothetical protein